MAMHVAYASDDNYAPYAGVSMLSLLENNCDIEEIVIHILDDQISDESKRILEELVSRYHREICYWDTSIFQQKLKEQITVPTKSLSLYTRLFLPSILPKKITRVIYIDCDSIITSSLKELWETDIGDCDIAGVLDVGTIAHKTNVGLNAYDPYFNSGMLLIDLGKWRDRNMEQQFLDFIEQYQGNVCHHDQGIINGVCRAKFILHPRYNAMTPFFTMSYKQLVAYYRLSGYYSEREIIEARNDPAFVHLTPGLVHRPWVKGSFHPLKKAYKKYQDQTPWAGLTVAPKYSELRSWLKWSYKIFPYWLFIRCIRMIISSNK